MITFIRCPCCGEEIPIQIDGDGSDTVTIFDLNNRFITDKFGIEFGMKGGDKNSK